MQMLGVMFKTILSNKAPLIERKRYLKFSMAINLHGLRSTTQLTCFFVIVSAVFLFFQAIPLDQISLSHITKYSIKGSAANIKAK
jgi:hypothetical protein